MAIAEARRTRVLVADGHPSVRENLRYLIDAEADLACVGVVKAGGRCVPLCQELAPDVLVLDSDMPGIESIMVSRALERALPHVRVVMYTLDPEMCQLARAFGAIACVAKDAPYEELLRTIRDSVLAETPT